MTYLFKQGLLPAGWVYVLKETFELGENFSGREFQSWSSLWALFGDWSVVWTHFKLKYYMHVPGVIIKKNTKITEPPTSNSSGVTPR